MQGVRPDHVRRDAVIRGLPLILLVVSAGLVAAEEDDLHSRARSIQDRMIRTIQTVRPAVVTVQVVGPDLPTGRPRRGIGSGVVVDPRGYVLTNYHVASWAEEITVVFAGWRRVKAKIRGRDPGGDLLLLTLEEPGPWPAATIAPKDDFEPGQWVLAMGNPRKDADDGRATVTWGSVAALHCLGGSAGDGRLYYGDAIQTDAEINPGNSGGPLFDLDGRLIGINGRIASFDRVSGAAVNANVGFAIPASQILRFLPLLIKGGIVRHGFLGIRLDGRVRDQAVVAVVQPGSAAREAGVRVGDVLLTLDGVEITSAERLTNLVTSRPAGARVALRIRRGSEERILVFPLGERKEGE